MFILQVKNRYIQVKQYFSEAHSWEPQSCYLATDCSHAQSRYVPPMPLSLLMYRVSLFLRPVLWSTAIDKPIGC